MEIRRFLLLISWTALLIVLYTVPGDYFYLPGFVPTDFKKNDLLQVNVKQLSSSRTLLPYSYYSLPYCRPDIIVDSAENLGEILRGDRIENSPYVFKMRELQVCNIVCKVTPNAKEVKDFREKIEDGYRINMIIDNLPLVVLHRTFNPVVLHRTFNPDNPMIHQYGFDVGFIDTWRKNRYFIINHLSFLVKYHMDAELDLARIVGFEVKPFSVEHKYEGEWDGNKTRLTTCDPRANLTVRSNDVPQEIEEKKDIIFTYDVKFEESEVKWASLWDAYLVMRNNQIDWFSILNSLITVLILSGMLAMIILRTLYRDMSKYNQLETQDEAQEETGWKVVHGDVFRPPAYSDLLCTYVGTGVQLFGMILVTVIFSVLGFISPSNRNDLTTAMVLLWLFMSLFAGYSSARLYKIFKGTEWKKIALRTATTFPAVVFAIFLFLHTLVWWETSSNVVPFTTIFILLFFWLGISVPLVFIGTFLGFKKPVVDDPVKTNKVPRQISEQSWYKNPIFSILFGGILSFPVVFMQLFFILESIWLKEFYSKFGFLFLVFLILSVTCAEITMVLCYFQLLREDYTWWWRSFLTSGSSALYLFLYTAFHFYTKMENAKLVSCILYLGYILIASYAFFVLTGTIGFCACFWFTRLIYSSGKIA